MTDKMSDATGLLEKVRKTIRKYKPASITPAKPRKMRMRCPKCGATFYRKLAKRDRKRRDMANVPPTPIQMEVLRIVIETYQRTGKGPSYRAVRERLGIRSNVMVTSHLRGLQRRYLVRSLKKNTVGGWIPTEKGIEWAAAGITL